ncbi:KOW domain-containing RNA-binding protein [Neofamilia massiliensis]|uniref:KOW domain-containing RNA-binding protein n=1 Tax=Neofamilia massiliensis TaxID=1673724 RepID=UPI0006BB7604|nr:KOW domain-containing RNA-binding protein [Neofamilia massiliensis]
MDSTRYLKVGQVVSSKNGRDAFKVFVIVEILDDKYVLIADGKRRTLEKPKKKKVNHLNIYKKVFEEIKSKACGKYQLNDAYIRRILKPFEEIELEKQEVSINE